MVTCVDEFEDIFREDYYNGLAGGVLEGLGQLFTDKTLAYVYPESENGSAKNLSDIPIAKHLEPLITYLIERGRITYLKNYIDSNDF